MQRHRACQGLEDKAWSHQKLEEVRKGPPLEASERLWLCTHLELRLVASRAEGDYEAPVTSHPACGLCCGGPRILTQVPRTQ